MLAFVVASCVYRPNYAILYRALIAVNCRVFDRDGNGFITRDELQTAMEMMQETVTEHQVNEMLQLADLDKDGKINYEGKCNDGIVENYCFASVAKAFSAAIKVRLNEL